MFSIPGQSDWRQHSDRKRIRAYPIRDDLHQRVSCFDPCRDIELGGMHYRTGVYAHGGVIVSPAIKNIICGGIDDSHQWIIRGHLRVIAVAHRLRQSVQLTSREHVCAARLQRGGATCYGWLPPGIGSTVRRINLHIVGARRKENLARGQEQHTARIGCSAAGGRIRHDR